MVIFDRLKISDNGKLMLINFHVNGADYFKNIYLESMTIMTADQVSETDPLTSTSKYIYRVEFGNEVRDFNEVIDTGALDAAYNNWNPTEEIPIDDSKPYASTPFSKGNLSNDLFFVYVKCVDAPIIGCPPCRLDELTTLGVTFDENILHQKVMGYTNELADTCKVSQGFSNFILMWQGFKSAIESEHYIPAIKFWNILFNNSVSEMAVTKSCGCYGKNSV